MGEETESRAPSPDTWCVAQSVLSGGGAQDAASAVARNLRDSLEMLGLSYKVHSSPASFIQWLQARPSAAPRIRQIQNRLEEQLAEKEARDGRGCCAKKQTRDGKGKCGICQVCKIATISAILLLMAYDHYIYRRRRQNDGG